MKPRRPARAKRATTHRASRQKLLAALRRTAADAAQILGKGKDTQR